MLNGPDRFTFKPNRLLAVRIFGQFEPVQCSVDDIYGCCLYFFTYRPRDLAAISPRLDSLYSALLS